MYQTEAPARHFLGFTSEHPAGHQTGGVFFMNFNLNADYREVAKRLDREHRFWCRFGTTIISLDKDFPMQATPEWEPPTAFGNSPE